MPVTVLSASVADAGQLLSSVAHDAARPTFNFTFARIQDAAIRRYNDSIVKIQNEALDKVDVSVEAQLKSIEEKLPKLQKYQNQIASLGGNLSDAIALMDTLDAEDAALQVSGSPDPTVYNATVDRLNALIGRLPFMDGSSIGDYTDEGIGNLRLNGLGLQHWSQADSPAELVAARTTLNDKAELVNTRLSGVAELVDDTARQLDDVTMRLIVKNAEIKDDVAKKSSDLKLQLAQQLNALSISFEVTLQQNERMAAALDGGAWTPGSVVNLFS